MKDLFQETSYQEAISRIEKLSPSSERLWGKMNVAQMLAHCAAALEVANGDMTLKRSFIGYLLGGLMKKKYIYSTEYKKNDPTDPSFVVANDRDFLQEKKRLLQNLERFHRSGETGIGEKMHSFFGKMTAQEWSLLMYNHLNHHLKQFNA